MRYLAEDVGFEPTEPLGSTVFKTAAFNHSANLPNTWFLFVRGVSKRTPKRQHTEYHIMLAMELDAYMTPSGWTSGRLDDDHYMSLALDQARKAYQLGEVPIGAVVVYDPIDPATRKYLLSAPRIVGEACNLRETTNDPAGHAEFLAMKQAAQSLDAWRLEGCCVYVTLEPCVMCAGLMHQSRVSRCVFGAPDQKAGAVGTLYRINEDQRLNHAFPVVPGVRKDECQELLKRFFKERREQRKQQRKQERTEGAN